MSALRFTGKVYPLPIQITLPGEVKINWRSSSLGVNLKMKVSIVKNEVSVICDLDKYDDNNFTLIHIRVLDIVRSMVDLYAFNSGCGFTVFLDTVIYEDGRSSSIVPMYPDVASLCTAFTTTPQTPAETNEFRDMLVIVGTDWRIFRALHDLIETLFSTHVLTVNPARVVESLRNIMATKDAPRNQAWKTIRDDLNISESYLKFITEHSVDRRHGGHAPVPRDISSEVVKRTWVIMNRFLEYKKRKDQPLPISDFPLLDG